MSDKDKNRAKDEFSELDFGSFEPEPPAGGHDAHAAHPQHASHDALGHDDLAGFDDADFGMPDPGGHPAHQARPATPDADFADLGDFGSAAPEEDHVPVHAEAEPEDDWGQPAVQPQRQAARPAARAAARPAAAAGFDDEDERGAGHDDEPAFDGEEGHAGHFQDAEMGGDDAEDGEDAEDGGRKSRIPGLPGGLDVSKLIMPVGGGIAAVLVGLMGYTYFISPMMGSDNPPATGPLTTVSERVQPAQQAMAGPRGGVSLDAPPAPTARQPFPSDAPSRPTPAPFPAQAAAPAPMPATMPGPMPSALAPQPSPSTTRLPDAAGPSMATAALSKADPSKADAAVDERIRQLQSRIDVLERQGSSEMQARMRQLEERVAQSESRAVPAAPRPETSVPYKPQVIDGWTLQGVNRDVAWVQGPGGLREVREGDDLGAAGKVMGIQRYKKDFIVVTSVGVIMRS